MPELDLSGRPVSFFEFWPTWLMYLPVVLQWPLLALRYRSFTLPLIANPAIPLSGMVGVSKSAVFEAAGEQARRWILPWHLHRVDGEVASAQTRRVLAGLDSVGLKLPLVGKPDVGCRGAGVKLLRNAGELTTYIESFPVGGVIQFQQLSEWEAEAGVFYVRHPEQSRGVITSLTLKYTPYVVGDGSSTLGELIARDPRAGALQHLYRSRHAASWEEVVPTGQPHRLVFSASHCRGAVFRDAGELINAKLCRTLDRIFDDIPGFHYGRLDIKFRDLDSLREGRDFTIIEINGASSESINIWDPNTDLRAAMATLSRQYRILFELGHANRLRGCRTPGLWSLFRAWRLERSLVKRYPAND